MLLNCGAGEDTWELLGLHGDQASQSYRKSTLNIHMKDWYWSWLWPPAAKNEFIGKDPDAEKDWRHKEKGATEEEMMRKHHSLSGHESKQTPGDSEGQGSLACLLHSMGSQRVGHDWETKQHPNSFSRLSPLKYNPFPFIFNKKL